MCRRAIAYERRAVADSQRATADMNGHEGTDARIAYARLVVGTSGHEFNQLIPKRDYEYEREPRHEEPEVVGGTCVNPRFELPKDWEKKQRCN